MPASKPVTYRIFITVVCTRFGRKSNTLLIFFFSMYKAFVFSFFSTYKCNMHSIIYRIIKISIDAMNSSGMMVTIIVKLSLFWWTEETVKGQYVYYTLHPFEKDSKK